MTENKWMHLECIVQITIGSLLAQVVLFAFGVHLIAAIELNIAMLSVGYARQYVIRRLFARLRENREHPAWGQFYDALENPPPPNDELKNLLRRKPTHATPTRHTPHGSL